MQLEHGALAELGGEEEAEVSVLGVDADVDDAAAALAVAVPVTVMVQVDCTPEIEVHRVSVIWSSDIWSFWLYFGYGKSDFTTKFSG